MSSRGLLRLVFVAVIALLSLKVFSAETPPVLRVALDGFDPVAYFTEGKPTKGVVAHSFVWDDMTYHFASVENRTRFAADPEKYAPNYGGYCAAAMGSGLKVVADPHHWLVRDDRLFVFATPRGRENFAADLNTRAFLADGNWEIQRKKP